MVMNKRAVIGYVFFLVGLFIAFGNNFVFADTSSTFSIDVSEAALQLTAPESATIVLNPISSAAVFGSTNFDVNVATNNVTGYMLSMSVSTTDLLHETIVGDDAPVIPTLENAASEANFPVNAWGYKAAGENYNPVLLINNPEPWSTTGPTNGTNHPVWLAAKVDGVKHAGTYETTLVFNAVAKPVPKVDVVSFDGNGADSGDMSDDTVVANSGESIDLPQNKFAKTGYRFIGWNTEPDISGQNFADQGEYTSTATTENQSVTLYAIWSSYPEGASTPGLTPSGKPGITISMAYELAYMAAGKGMWEKNETGDGYTQVAYGGTYHNRDVRWDMQGMTPEICNMVTVLEDSYSALDIRDFHLYSIVKLADGRCWMRENLALNLTSQGASQRILSSNTNADASTLASMLSGVRDYSTSSNDSYTAGRTYSNLVNTVNAEDSVEDVRNVKYGIMYNYCAASAGSICFSYGYSGHTNATRDICPTGWRLPTGGTNGEFQTLADSYQTIVDLRIASHFAYSGNFNFYYGQEMGQGVDGRYWSSTMSADSGNLMYDLFIYDSDAGTTDPGWRNDGFTIRCIAKP